MGVQTRKWTQEVGWALNGLDLATSLCVRLRGDETYTMRFGAQPSGV